MHNKKRSRKVLNKQLMSMDFGQMAPPESDSSEDDMFTGPRTGTATPLLKTVFKPSRALPQLASTGVILEPLPNHLGASLAPLRARRAVAGHQGSTERETLTSEDEASTASPARPGMQVTGPRHQGEE